MCASTFTCLIMSYCKNDAVKSIDCGHIGLYCTYLCCSWVTVGVTMTRAVLSIQPELEGGTTVLGDMGTLPLPLAIPPTHTSVPTEETRLNGEFL